MGQARRPGNRAPLMLHRGVVDDDRNLIGGCQLLGDPPGLYRLLQCRKDLCRRFVLLTDTSLQRFQGRCQFGFLRQQSHFAGYTVELLIRAGTKLHPHLHDGPARAHADEWSHEKYGWTLQDRIDPSRHSAPELLKPGYNLRRAGDQPMWIAFQAARPYVVDMGRYVENAVAATINNPDRGMVWDGSSIRIATFSATHNRVKAQRERNRSSGHSLQHLVVSGACTFQFGRTHCGRVATLRVQLHLTIKHD